MHPIATWTKHRFHYAWMVIAVTFLIMLVTAGIRATPSVMMVPLERSFGWSRTTISMALAINLALFGLMGPFAAAAMQRFGMRRTVLAALTVLAIAVALSGRMHATWQMVLIWGVLVGSATGATSTTLGAVVVNRWFLQHRGLAMGILTASSATGQLAFLPLFGLFYGLDWIATVPPTVRLTTDVFGSRDAPAVFGWVVAGHQLGAAFAALGAGMLRSTLGTYTMATMISGALCVVGAFLVLRINRPTYAPAAASA